MNNFKNLEKALAEYAHYPMTGCDHSDFKARSLITLSVYEDYIVSAFRHTKKKWFEVHKLPDSELRTIRENIVRVVSGLGSEATLKKFPPVGNKFGLDRVMGYTSSIQVTPIRNKHYTQAKALLKRKPLFTLDLYAYHLKELGYNAMVNQRVLAREEGLRACLESTLKDPNFILLIDIKNFDARQAIKREKAEAERRAQFDYIYDNELPAESSDNFRRLEKVLDKHSGLIDHSSADKDKGSVIKVYLYGNNKAVVDFNYEGKHLTKAHTLAGLNLNDLQQQENIVSLINDLGRDEKLIQFKKGQRSLTSKESQDIINNKGTPLLKLALSSYYNELTAGAYHDDPIDKGFYRYRVEAIHPNPDNPGWFELREVEWHNESLKGALEMVLADPKLAPALAQAKRDLAESASNGLPAREGAEHANEHFKENLCCDFAASGK
jgi:hypothetical protein